jgi:hypothetical protein
LAKGILMPAPANLVHQTSTTTGTGNLTVAAVNGKQSFSDAFGTGGSNVFDYFISNQNAAEWERGTGSMSDATTLVRDTVLESTNSDAAVNFSAGTKDITNDVPAANQVRNENSTVTDNHGVLFDGTSGRAIKSLGGVPNVLNNGTVQATTSGTSINFTSIPSGTKRITVIFDQVSLSGTDDLLVQIGDSGGLETTGYVSASTILPGTGQASGTSTSGFIIEGGNAARAYSGHMVLTNITGNTWVESFAGAIVDSGGVVGGGTKSLSAVLDRLSIVATGANTFDAGQINIFYE